MTSSRSSCRPGFSAHGHVTPGCSFDTGSAPPQRFRSDAAWRAGAPESAAGGDRLSAETESQRSGSHQSRHDDGPRLVDLLLDAASASARELPTGVSLSSINASSSLGSVASVKPDKALTWHDADSQLISRQQVISFSIARRLPVLRGTLRYLIFPVPSFRPAPIGIFLL